jgi:anti-anti-sigma factor
MSDLSEDFGVDVVDAGRVVTVRGEIDAHTCGRLQAAIDRAIDLLGPDEPRLLVDVGAVGFIDSSGLRVLVNAANRLDDSGTKLTLRNPSATVLRLLEVTGLDEHFLEA